MADLVSEIISQGALDQLELANAQLELAVKNVNNVASAAKGIVIDFKGAANIGELNAAMAKQAENINTITEATKKYEAAVDKKQRAIEIAERRAQAEIEKTQKASEKAAKQAEMDAETKRKNAEREEKALAKLNNAYEQLKVQYKAAADEAKKLGAQFGVNDAKARAAADSAMKLYNSLLAVEKSVGQAQRQVGQYNQAAFAMQQVLRETPAFAYSFATGISAISNNIPPLIDALKQAKQSNDALVASGGTSIPIWKTLGKELLSFGGIATILVGVGTIVAAQWKNISGYFKKAGEELSKFTAEASKNAAQEMSNAKVLAAVAANTKEAMNIRIEAVKELQSLYPHYLGNMSQEAILAGETASAMERLNEALINKSIMEAYSEKVGEQAGKFAELTDKLNEAQKVLVDLEAKERKSFELLNQVQYGKSEGAVNLNQSLRNQVAATKKEITSLQKDITDTENKMKEYQKSAEMFGKKAAGVLVGETKDPKAKKEKKVKDTTFKSESDLLRAEYELSKQRTEQNAATLKDIADNEKNALNQRLDAYMEYQSELFQLSILERDYIINQENLKIAELQRKRKDASKAEQENIDEQITAANTRIKTATEKTAGEFIGIEKKAAEGRLSIIKSANDEYITNQEQFNQQLKQTEIAQYLVEEQLLLNALNSKEMSRREYNKRLAELQKKQQIAFLQNEIEFDKKILANQSLTAEKRKQFEEKLLNDKKALFNAEKGIATPQRQGFRITDSLARMFVPDDLENEEQYLEEFYDRTVELANQAANAIIEAKNRQYEEENRRLDEQARKIEANYQEQSRLINATVKDETERYNQQQKLLAQTEAQQAGIEDRKREVARRQAQAQKAASIAAIIQNTAVAITKAISQFTVGAAPIVALIAASGAVQLAAAANTPIPAYKEGTTYHKGGKFIAGDGGEKELIIAPNKKPYWSNSISTLYDEAEGTKVIPKSAMQYAMANTTSNVGNLSAAYEARNSAIIAETIASIVSREFDKTGRKLANVIVNSQPKQKQTESVADELRKMRNLQGL